MKTPALFLILLIIASCENDDVVTDCDRAVSKVKEYKQYFSTVDIYEAGSSGIFDAPYVIEGNFIGVQGMYYNLCFVRKVSNDDNSLILHF